MGLALSEAGRACERRVPMTNGAQSTESVPAARPLGRPAWLLVDAHGRIEAVGGEAERFFAMSDNGLLQLRLQDLVVESDGQVMWLLRACLDGAVWSSLLPRGLSGVVSRCLVRITNGGEDPPHSLSARRVEFRPLEPDGSEGR